MGNGIVFENIGYIGTQFLSPDFHCTLNYYTIKHHHDIYISQIKYWRKNVTLLSLLNINIVNQVVRLILESNLVSLSNYTNRITSEI